MKARLTFRLDFGGDRRLGHGKVALLEAIGTTGSISAAGRTFDMSYRRAWLLVDEMNRMFREPLVATRGGGRGGGGASLTENGEAVIRLYRAAEKKMALAARAELEAIKQALVETETGQS